MRLLHAALLGAALALGAAPARAAEPSRFELVIRDHRFEPAELHVPADTAFVIVVKNADATAEELESPAMGVEKIIPGGRSLQVRIRPLKPGRYPFFGEYNSATAQGVVIVGTER